MEEGNWRKPFECLLQISGVEEVSGRKVATCKCPNSVFGCKWRGEVNNYLLHHLPRCNFQVVRCHCKQEMFKGHFGKHLYVECKNRFVDYSNNYEKQDDLYGDQECPRAQDGCQWCGTSARYEEVHMNQCIYQDVPCYCGSYVKKWFLAEHVTTNCNLRLDLQPGTSFSHFIKPEIKIKTKDGGVQCDIIQHQIKELEKQVQQLKSALALLLE